MHVIGVIPARMASTRFPGKALVDIGGKSMIRRVYEQAQKCKALDDVYVATDHAAIAEEVHSFGGQVIMTSSEHQNGTSRCAEVLSSLATIPEILINIQGDEPFFNPSDLDILIACFEEEKTQIATLAKRIEKEEDIHTSSVVKLVFDKNYQALYFSRAAIPFSRDKVNADYFKHIGIYAYRAEVLQEIIKLPSSSLEQAEQLEQLRWLENAYRIQIGLTNHDSNSVDTPEDLISIKKQFNL